MENKKNILITGGAGYIGSHTAKLLSQLGYNTVVYDSLITGHKEAVKWSKPVQGDLKDKDLLVRTMKQEAIHAVIHFAAFSLVAESVANPKKYFENNVEGSKSLIQAMKEAGVKYIVFSSTAAVYGIPQNSPILESFPLKPVNPYGETKKLIEEALAQAEMDFGLRWVALRYFNAAGADPDGEIGEKHTTETHLIPIALDVVLGKRDQLQVFGSDYNTPDRTAVRDYIHVTDLADAHIKALAYLEARRKCQAMNLGTGNGHSILEVVRMIEKVTGKKMNLFFAPRREGDPPSLIAKADRARELLNWTPKYSDLETIIRTAYQWSSSPKF